MSKDVVVLTYSDFFDVEDIASLCRDNNVVLDFKLYDIPATMRRNIRTCANIGASTVTVADCPLNCPGISEAHKAGNEYGIKIIVGDFKNG